MHHFATVPFLEGIPVQLGVSAAVFLIALLFWKLVGRVNVVDVAWGAGFAAVALVSFLLSAGHGSTDRRVLVLVLTAVWGLRLAGYIGLRQRGAPDDPRYDEMLAKGTGNPTAYMVRKVHLTQTIALWFVSLPVQIAMYERGGLGVLTWIGAAIWAVGLFFEGVGDAQMASFKANPANKGTVMNHGLWRYTRHPNYFGDACVWTGLFLIAAQQWPGVLTILSPAIMIFFLAKGTGKAVLEKAMGNRPGYADYIKATSGFVPLPPRKLG